MSREINVAVIDESKCVGCTKCRQACPIDCIVGAHQFMHTVISFECTGCKLCIAPCPVDCISLIPSEERVSGKYAKDRIKNRNERLKSKKNLRKNELRNQKNSVLSDGASLIADIIKRKKNQEKKNSSRN
tara:strand:+ start:264 stop:653 length:390 start_codon:yes stop_codon:yes gene_type:complete